MKSKPDMKADINPATDRGESVGLMEPLLIGESSRFRGPLLDLSLELTAKSTGFRRSLPEKILASLADLVRAMNCYYSNLIEGHATHPIDIERALKNDYSKDAGKRDLQLEAKAHITVQKWIDGGGLRGRSTTRESICEIHQRFYDEMPEDLRWAQDESTKDRVRIIPGAFRARDVQVGHHVPVSPGAVPRFLNRFEDAYGRLGTAEFILAIAAAHHRFAWIHPFLDGNGRVARLMSHAMLLDVLDTGSVWSVSRGLARNVESYKTHLANCDLPRRNNLDGRGTLSEEALMEFTRFFLKTCIDQVSFMEGLMQPDRLRTRILLWTEEETRLGNLPPQSGAILEAVLYRGELPRGEIPGLLNVGERQARRIVSALLTTGVVIAATSKAPLHLAFPATLAARWMPGLFPEKTD